METAEKTIGNKIKLLNYTNKDTELIIERRKQRELGRRKKNIEYMLEEIYAVKMEAIEQKIIEEVNQEEIDEWVASIDEQTNSYEEILEQLKETIVSVKKETKEVIPIHLILGASEISRIKTSTRPRIGVPGEPVAEYTKFGWTMMSPGKETDLSNIHLTKTVIDDYDRLTRLDVLGIEDRASGDQDSVYSDFKEQLRRSNEGWYETGLLWKVDHPPLPTNKNGSLGRLSNLLKKLKHRPLVFEEYNKVIENHIEQGIVERVDDTSKTNNKEFYLPHKAVIRETAETTKLRVVFDASAKADNAVPSLNDCLETGPSLQNLLWNILV